MTVVTTLTPEPPIADGRRTLAARRTAYQSAAERDDLIRAIFLTEPGPAPRDLGRGASMAVSHRSP